MGIPTPFNPLGTLGSKKPKTQQETEPPTEPGGKDKPKPPHVDNPHKPQKP